MPLPIRSIWSWCLQRVLGRSASRRRLGKLTAPDDFERQVDEGGFTRLPISIAHGIAAGQLPRHHDDPFDRMLIAQAFAEGLTVVTHDKRFTDYDLPTLPT